MFDTVLVANRGEIARRVIRGVHAVGARAVAVYSDADAQALHVKEADEAMLLGPAPAHQSYLDGTKVIQAARRSGARAIHPGYGFLAENADFADSVQAAGLAWVGPSPESIRLMGDKINARNLMAAAGVPVAPGTAEPQSNVESAVAAARVIGYPVMVKARPAAAASAWEWLPTRPACVVPLTRPGPAPSVSSGHPPSCSSATSPTLGTSRSKCSA